MKIYLVNGTYGEYGDKIQWNVVAYKNKEEAKILVDNINKEIEILYQKKHEFIGDYKCKTIPNEEIIWKNYTYYIDSLYYDYEEIELI